MSAPDLELCAREPIHVPGSIQPHGMLLSLDPATLRVLQASENLPVRGGTLAEILGEEQAAALLPALQALTPDAGPVYLGSVRVSSAEPPFGAVAHGRANTLIVEFEPGNAPQNQIARDWTFSTLVSRLLPSLQQADTLPQLAHRAAEEVRRITGFDRVLVYRFDPDWNGHVIGESRSPEVPSYLDLWFPASDIPAQARELYRLNRLRLIVDANYLPVPLAPTLDPRTGAPLDLTFASLRSVSPIHVEYLKNMGVVASMSISVIRDGELWGLIALHHRSARYVPFEVRAACDFLGQVLSMQLTALENRSEYRERLRARSLADQLLGFMSQEERFIDGLVKHPAELLSFAGAAGAAVLYEGRCFRLGEAPEEEQVWRIGDWLMQRGQEEVFATDRLPSLISDGDGIRQLASGLLAISISKLYRSYVLWFRPEVVQTVTWGGDPNKPVATENDGAMRIHPRKSFAAWKEMVHGRALPWQPAEVDSATQFRNAIVGVVLRKAEELAALSAELQRSNKELEAFSYSVSHDLRAPFRHIVGYSNLLRDHIEPHMDETADRFLSTISAAAESAGTLVDSLLNFSRVGRTRLHLVALNMDRLVEEVRRELDHLAAGRNVTWNVAPLPVVQADPVLMRLVWQNLLSNALKYTRGRDPGIITVGATSDDIERTFFVRDNGVGFKQQYVNKLFGVFQRLHTQEEFEGTGIGLANVRRAVGKHGGRTWAEGDLDKGATFYFSLPHRVHPERGHDA